MPNERTAVVVLVDRTCAAVLVPLTLVLLLLLCAGVVRFKGVVRCAQSTAVPVPPYSSTR